MRALVPIECPSNILISVNGCFCFSAVFHWVPSSSRARPDPGHHRHSIVAYPCFLLPSILYHTRLEHSPSRTARAPVYIFQRCRERFHFYFLSMLLSLESSSAAPESKVGDALTVHRITLPSSWLRFSSRSSWLYLFSFLKVFLSGNLASYGMCCGVKFVPPHPCPAPAFPQFIG